MFCVRSFTIFAIKIFLNNFETIQIIKTTGIHEYIQTAFIQSLWRLKPWFLRLKQGTSKGQSKRRIKNVIHDPSRILVLSLYRNHFYRGVPAFTSISAENRNVSFIDALFTSTSAVCVTGLATIDVGREFNLFGEIVLLSLIQIGGLGIMTLSIIFMMAENVCL